MNRTSLLGGLAALALIAVGGVAVAQQATNRPAAPTMRADADGDGRLSQAEFVGRRLDRLRAADANGDGSVSMEERQAMRQAHRAARADARFDRLDADNNGAISRAEFDAAHAASGDRGPRGMRGRHGGGAHAGMRAAGPVEIAGIESRAVEAFARLDADRDGYLAVEERRVGRHGMRGHGRGHMAPQASPPAPSSE
ncbi:EF-hand domain-containing protein [Brevundimonas viscosa]|uniref:EF hand n=1 Tax=Brevundimonas viscosa TaxID=871741 RepID=A0A1I6QIA4_9CAUL|nr:EF-hand domain-containing protein [Brevundimonas viscosa]SFS52186.1 EF hand [Brevundimonas viscosa]